MKRTLSLFRYTLLRTVAALFVFELLVGLLAYALLMHPVLDKRAQTFAQQLLQNSASLSTSVTRVSAAPLDAGPSYLPFIICWRNSLKVSQGKRLRCIDSPIQRRIIGCVG